MKPKRKEYCSVCGYVLFFNGYCPVCRRRLMTTPPSSEWYKWANEQMAQAKCTNPQHGGEEGMSAERACDNCRKLTPMSELRSLCPDCKCWTLEELRKAQND